MQNKNEESPYLRGKNEWMERYGSYIVQARNARIFAFFCLILAACSLIFATHNYSEPKVQAFAVEYCAKSGEYSAKVLKPLELSEIQTQAAIAQWIIDLRSVSSDKNVLIQNNTKAFAQIEKGSQAANKAKEDYEKLDPHVRAQTETVEVTIDAVTRENDNTFKIDWKETVRDVMSKKIKEEKKQRATVKYNFSKKVLPDEMLTNPTGLRIGEYRWTNFF